MFGKKTHYIQCETSIVNAVLLISAHQLQLKNEQINFTVGKMEDT